VRTPKHISKRSVLITVLQTFWLFLSIVLLCIFILLMYIPGLNAPSVLLSISPGHSSANQLGCTFFAFCMVTAITVLHFLESNKATKLSIILSFLIVITLAFNLFSTSTPVPLHHYGLFFTVALMIIFDAFIESDKIAAPKKIKRKFPVSSDLSMRLSDHSIKSNMDVSLMSAMADLEALLAKEQ
jgi:hypothetical protein